MIASPVAGFVARFVVVVVAGAALWPWVVPPWQRAVAAVANPLLAPTTRIVLPAGGGQSYLHRRGAGDEVETVGFDRTGLALQTLGLVLLPALMLATPPALRRRLGLLAPGLVLLFAVQVAAALAWAPVARCLNGDPDDPWCGWAFGLLVASGQLSAVAIWGAATWRSWIAAALPPSRDTKR